MATAAATPNGLTKFVPGFEPEAIALKYGDGKPVTSTYNGDQVMFTLMDGRRWFADLYVAEKIAGMKLQPGEVFEVAKTETRRGNQRIVQVEITAPVKPAPVNGADSSRQIAATPSPLQHQHPNGSVPSHPTPVAPMNGNGETSAAQLTRCYRSAVDIALNAMAYAKEQGLLITPDFADIRALAATLAISETGRRQ